MDFRFNETQDMLQRTARDFFKDQCPPLRVREIIKNEAGHDANLWQHMADLGWLGLIFPEKHGGVGGSFLDLAVLLEEMGRACAPGPFFPTVVLAGQLALQAPGKDQISDLIPEICEGMHIATLAIGEPTVHNDASCVTTRATRSGDHLAITGTKLFVPYAHVSDSIFCAVQLDGAGPTLVLVPARGQGVTIETLHTLNGEPLCKVKLDGARVPLASIVGKPGSAREHLDPVLQKAAVACAIQMVGAMQEILRMTVSYAKERVQFGKPIGSFQAIQHHCANMALDVEAARLFGYETAWKISEGKDARMEASLAKAWISEAFIRATRLAHQVHGGVGLMQEHNLPLYTTKSPYWVDSLGDPDYHWERASVAMGL